MNKNYVIFTNIGGLDSSSFTPISKGNNKVDELYIYFAGFTYSDGYVTVATTLPDGTSLPELSASNSTFTYNNNTYNGFKLLITDALTSIAGTVSFTARFKSNANDSILCSSQVLSLTIHNSDVPGTPTITDAQYDNITETINANYNTLNTNKLDKVFTNYSSAGTISSSDKVILNQSGTPVYANLGDTYNILSVNSVTPVNRNISLSSENIPHSNTTVSGAITSLETNVETRALKTTVSQKVGHRDGSLSTIEEVATGLLNTTTDIYEDTSTFARILYSDGFLDGDIIDVAITYNHTEDGETTSKVVNIVKIIDVGNNETLHTYAGTLAMNVSSTTIAFSFDSANDVPTAISAKVRR